MPLINLPPRFIAKFTWQHARPTVMWFPVSPFLWCLLSHTEPYSTISAYIFIHIYIYIYHGKPQRESNPCPWVCVDVGESSGSRSLFLTASSLPLPLSLTLNSFFNTAPRSFLSSVHALNRAVHLQHPPLHTYMSDVWHHFFALTQSSGGRPHQQMKKGNTFTFSEYLGLSWMCLRLYH